MPMNQTNRKSIVHPVVFITSSPEHVESNGVVAKTSNFLIPKFLRLVFNFKLRCHRIANTTKLANNMKSNISLQKFLQFKKNGNHGDCNNQNNVKL